MKERNYWMHRITHERNVKEAFLDKDGLLFTGWGTLSNDAFLDSVLHKEKPEYDRIYISETGYLPHNRFFLYMFLNEYGKGDYILVPGNKDFSVYEITSERPFSKEHIKEYAKNLAALNVVENGGKYFVSDTGEELELGFFWKVKPVELNISREQYAKDSLRRRMKFQGTDNNLTPLSLDVDEAIKRHQDNSPLFLKNEIVNTIWNFVLEKLQNISSDSAFEKVTKYYLERLGATNVMIPAKTLLSKEQGDADVVAYFEALQIKVIVQVKHYMKEVNEEAVKQILAAKSFYEDSTYTVIPWVVAACDTYSDDAQSLAEENGVRLITGSEFARLLLDVGFGTLDL
jgi:HJR/Mrr/RecB family endonuclease